MPHIANFADEPHRTWPAWGMSLGLHLALFLVIGLCLRAAPKSLPASGEADRTVGIVLAAQSSVRSTEYFSEAEADSDSMSAAQQVVAAETSATPETAPPPVLANVSLPSRADALFAGGASDLIAQPGLRVSNKRPQILPGLGEEAILAADVVRNRPAGPSGPPGKVSLFGTAAVEGHSFVFVIDRSNSMGDGGLGMLGVAEVELLKALAGLTPEHKFQIIAYNERVMYFSESGLVAVTEDTPSAVRTFFTSMGAIGGTEHEPALAAALRLKPDVIFLFTDGGDPRLNAGQIDRLAARTEGRTSIHCLQFGLGPLQEDDNFMQRLAGRARGSYGYIDMGQVRRGR